jgi:hypothetical protein
MFSLGVLVVLPEQTFIFRYLITRCMDWLVALFIKWGENLFQYILGKASVFVRSGKCIFLRKTVLFDKFSGKKKKNQLPFPKHLCNKNKN